MVSLQDPHQHHTPNSEIMGLGVSVCVCLCGCVNTREWENVPGPCPAFHYSLPRIPGAKILICREPACKINKQAGSASRVQLVGRPYAVDVSEDRRRCVAHLEQGQAHPET